MVTVRGAVGEVPVVLRRARQRATESVGWRRQVGCRAPFASIYLAQSGDVRACCQNWWLPLGNIAEQRLRDIWRGDRAEVLRAAILAGDYSMGCDFCQWQVDDGAASTVYARNFDTLPLSTRHPDWPAQMEFSVSNTCNLQCTMCRGEWSSSIRAQREHLPPLPKVYGTEFFDDLAEFLPHLREVKFYGGEPFLARESLQILEMIMAGGLRPVTWVTTNGTIWNDRVERIVAELAPNVDISMDAFDAAAYERIRVGATFSEVVANVDRFRDAAESSGARTDIAFTLMRDNWRSLPGLFRFGADHRVGVGVNTLMDPPEMSLFTMPADELAPVVAELERHDAEMQRLDPHLASTWVDQLARLRRHLEAVATESVSADLVYERARTHHRFEPVASGDPTVADREQEIVATSPAGWARLDFDGDGIVVGGNDAGFGRGIDLVAATGGLAVAAVEELVAPRATRVLRTSHEGPSVWDRTFAVGPDQGEQVRLVMAPRRDAEGVTRSLVLWLARLPTTAETDAAIGSGQWTP